ncbi:MAG: DUF2461 domain-containing protein [Geobacteraceae bacterium]|nr:DUF2461 domain-containing protein [Geobacteraceae bacterium]
MSSSFPGFSPQALAFFEELAANNRKDWFEAHRSDYEEFLLEPLKSLVAALANTMVAIDGELVTMPAVDKTISRIYRDTRFSRDKSPYKCRMWLTFKRYRPDWKETPCFYFEINAEGYRYGMGFYCAAKDTMDRLRQYIESSPERFREEIAWLAGQDRFVVAGESYKRPLNAALPDDLQQWHMRKNLYLVCNRPPSRLFSAQLLEEIQSGFQQLAPLYRLLWQLR